MCCPFSARRRRYGSFAFRHPRCSCWPPRRRTEVSALPHGSVWWLLAAVGLLDTTAYVANNAGLHAGPVSVVTVIASLYGAVTVLLSWIFLRERLERSQWLGIFLSSPASSSSAYERSEFSGIPPGILAWCGTHLKRLAATLLRSCPHATAKSRSPFPSARRSPTRCPRRSMANLSSAAASSCPSAAAR